MSTLDRAEGTDGIVQPNKLTESLSTFDKAVAELKKSLEEYSRGVDEVVAMMRERQEQVRRLQDIADLSIDAHLPAAQALAAARALMPEEL